MERFVLMNITLYSTHCPKCAIVEKKLNMANIKYDICDDVNKMKELGFMSAPMLVIDGTEYKFKEAVDWVNNVIKGVVKANAD